MGGGSKWAGVGTLGAISGNPGDRLWGKQRLLDPPECTPAATTVLSYLVL